MQKIIIFFIFTINCNAQDSSLTDLLTYKNTRYDERYYRLLPKVIETTPALTFVPSRNLQSMALHDLFVHMIGQTFNDAYVMVETGTYLGDTTCKIEKYFRVETIELDEKLANKSKDRFAGNNRVKVHHGDTVNILPRILQQYKNDKIIIFLDAHYSQGDSAKGAENTPILTELSIIKKAGIKDAILIIDDIRMFYNPLTDVSSTFVEGYPNLQNVAEYILSINQEYQCVVIYDALVAFPAYEEVTVSPVVHAATISRLYDGNNYHINDVLKAELTLAQAREKEQEALIELGRYWTEQWGQAAGLMHHNALWAGLVFCANGQYDIAKIFFSEAKRRGLHHWRIDFYNSLAQAECFFAHR